MAVNDLISQFLGAAAAPGAGSQQAPTGSGGTATGPGGMAGGILGGAAAGGVMGLVMGNKKARKTVGKVAGTAAAVGGMALLGGLAYKGYQNWKERQAPGQAPAATVSDAERAGPAFNPQEPGARAELELVLIKAMIAAARSDGHIDAQEQTRIFDAVERLQLPADQKGVIFDCLRRDIPVTELAAGVGSLEHKSDLYLAACLAIDVDHPAERAFLTELGRALDLPPGLAEHLEQQAREGMQA